MTPIERYNRMRAEVDDARDGRERARGAKDQLLKRLKAQFSCKSLEDGEDQLRRLRAEEAKLEKQFDRLLGKFEDEWGGKLNED